MKDSRDVPINTGSQEAADAYSRAVDESVLYVGDPMATAAQALEADPNLVLAHTLNAMYNLLGNTRTGLADALACIEAAEAVANGASDRERGHIAATRAWYEGDFAASSLHWDQVLAEHPRDLFALQMGHLLDFYTANACNLRDRVARVLPAWSDDTPLRDAVSGMYAFGLEEAGSYRQAEEEGLRDEANSVIAALEREAAGKQCTSRMAREIGLPVARAINAFVDGSYSRVVDELLPIRYDTKLFGGSHAQRDVLAQTLILAAIRDGQNSLARALLAERSALKPPTEASFTGMALAAVQ